MIDYIKEILDQIAAFDSIEHVNVEPGDGSVLAYGFATDKTIFVSAESPPVEGISNAACFGNLSYLHKISGMDQFHSDRATVSADVGASSSGEEVVKRINFLGSRLKVVYEATDPKNSTSSIPKIKVDDWPVVVEIEPEHKKLFSEAMSLQKIQDPTDDKFKVRARDGEVRFLFGREGKEIDVLIAQTTGELERDVPFKSSRVGTILGTLAKASNAKISFAKIAMKAEMTIGDTDYVMIAPMLIEER